MPSEPQFDEREIAKEMAMHEAREAIERLYQTIPPQDAHWLCTVAIIAADKKCRERQRS